MFRKTCCVFALVVLAWLVGGCKTVQTSHTHYKVRTNPAGTVVTAKAGHGPNKVMIKSNPAQTIVKVKEKK